MTSSARALPARTIAEVLDLEQVDRDLFRAPRSIMSPGRPSLFGGQVAAQALMAAGLTVPEGRLPHSLHGYFLRPGIVERPVVLQVARDRDGRSFSARHVAAVQDGEVIFSMLASFHVGGDGAVLDDVGAVDVPDPEGLRAWPTPMALDMVPVTRHEVVDGHQKYSDTFWARADAPLPADPLTHACAIAFVSDLGTGFGQIQDDVIGYGGPSIDHALWFHEPLVADDWMLVRLWPGKAIARRAVYHGAVRDRRGRLGATLTQEHLLLATPPVDVRER
jgi:acyl-CoA thioesterase-2